MEFFSWFYEKEPALHLKSTTNARAMCNGFRMKQPWNSPPGLADTDAIVGSVDMLILESKVQILNSGS